MTSAGTFPLRNPFRCACSQYSRTIASYSFRTSSLGTVMRIFTCALSSCVTSLVVFTPGTSSIAYNVKKGDPEPILVAFARAGNGT